MNKAKSLKMQLIISFLLVCFFTMSVCIGVLYTVIRNETREKLIQQNIHYSNQIAFVLDYFLQDIMHNITNVSTSNEIMDATQFSGIIDYQSVLAFQGFIRLTERNIENLSIDSFFFFLDNGVIIGRNSRANIFINPDNPVRTPGVVTIQSPMFAELNDSSVFSFLGVFDSQLFNYENINISPYLCLTFARSVHWLPLGYSGIVVVNVRENVFRSLYSSVESTYNIAYVVDNNGRIISHKNPEEIGEIDDIFLSMRNQGLKTSAYQLAGERFHATYSAVGETGLSFMILLPDSEITSGMNHYRTLIIITFIVIIILTVPVLSYIVTQFKNFEAEKRKSELQALQAYINPHFLYNTVNAFRIMAAVINAKKLTAALNSFASILKPLYAVNSEMWTINEEKEFITNYAVVMNYRFGGGVNVSINIPNEILSLKILKFTIQPLIENAFMYGIDPDVSIGRIFVDFSLTQNQ